jgi:8-oxo-dGTP diphosphatase
MRPRQPVRAFVSVLLVNARGEVLLHLRDDRPGLDGANTWSTLGGLIEPGESAEETARRELLEECGRTVERLVPVGVAERVRPDTGQPYRIHLFAAAVDWSLADLSLGEGQGLAWWPWQVVPRLSLNRLVSEEIVAFAGSPLLRELAAAAPPAPPVDLAPLPPGFAERLGVRPGSLVAVEGVSAAFAERLRAALPAGARLTASPAPDEHPAVTLWRVRGAAEPARFLTLAARMHPRDVLWVIASGRVLTAVRHLWAAAAALRLAFEGTAPLGDNEEGACFVRRRGTLTNDPVAPGAEGGQPHLDRP